MYKKFNREDQRRWSSVNHGTTLTLQKPNISQILIKTTQTKGNMIKEATKCQHHHWQTCINFCQVLPVFFNSKQIIYTRRKSVQAVAECALELCDNETQFELWAVIQRERFDTKAIQTPVSSLSGVTFPQMELHFLTQNSAGICEKDEHFIFSGS